MQGVKPSKLDPSWTGQASDASADVVSSFNGQAKIHDGVLSTQRITLEMPGVDVDLSGSFDLRNSTGRSDRQSSHAIRHFPHHDRSKSALMKPLIPFFNKDRTGAVISIAVTGGHGGYKVTQNLLHRK
jgi:hypothetical protein